MSLPIYKANVDMLDDSGMVIISFVDLPAVERNFLSFSSKKGIMSYKIMNEEKQKVFGVVMECNKPIYRNDNGFEYYIVFDEKTIELMTEKYFKNGYQNNVDTNHNLKLEDGITLTQMFIKNSEKGIIPNGFEDVSDGSLFAEFHVENNEVWDSIKKGDYKGFSLCGSFNVKQKPDEYDDIMELITKIENKLK